MQEEQLTQYLYNVDCQGMVAIITWNNYFVNQLIKWGNQNRREDTISLKETRLRNPTQAMSKPFIRLY